MVLDETDSLVTVTKPRHRGAPTDNCPGEVSCPVCPTVTGTKVIEYVDGYQRTVIVLNKHASGISDGYRCWVHSRTLEQREAESTLALLGYESSGFARGE